MKTQKPINMSITTKKSKQLGSNTKFKISCQWCKKTKLKGWMWDNRNCNSCIDRLRSSLFSCFLE